ncbi:MAG: squalene/phytoene synthase family protein [Pseudomonadota bacterium]
MAPDRFSPLSPDDAAYVWAEVERFEPHWLLVLPYVAEDRRGAWLALLGFFAEALTIPGRVSNPMLGAIRVAWWREAIGEVYGDGPPRKHPVVTALAASVSDRSVIRPFLEKALDALAPFLEPGDDHDIDVALTTRFVLYGAMAGALGELDGTEASDGEALAFHALAAIQPDPSAAATAEGPEPIHRRFARGIAAHPTMQADLAERVAAFRQQARRGQPLSAAPFALVRGTKRKVSVAQNPLIQRFLIFRAVLTGSF